MSILLVIIWAANCSFGYFITYLVPLPLPLIFQTERKLLSAKIPAALLYPMVLYKFSVFKVS